MTMRSKKVLFIDGNETRKAVDWKAGRKRGMEKLCRELGVSQQALSRICVKGYGSPDIIKNMMDAGVPIITSKQPVPSRTKRPFNRTAKKQVPEEKHITVEPPKTSGHPKQISIDDYTEAAQLKDILIKGLQNIIDELKKI